MRMNLDTSVVNFLLSRWMCVRRAEERTRAGSQWTLALCDSSCWWPHWSFALSDSLELISGCKSFQLPTAQFTVSATGQSGTQTVCLSYIPRHHDLTRRRQQRPQRGNLRGHRDWSVGQGGADRHVSWRGQRRRSTVVRCHDGVVLRTTAWRGDHLRRFEPKLAHGALQR